MRGMDAVMRAQTAALEMLDQAEDGYAVLASCGVESRDAERTALSVIADTVGQLKPLREASAAQAAFQRQAERAFINGCLVGLLLEGSARGERLAPTALMSARMTHAKQAAGDMAKRSDRKLGQDWFRQQLVDLDLEPHETMRYAMAIGGAFAETLEGFALSRSQTQRCVLSFMSIWVGGVQAATIARRDHGRLEQQRSAAEDTQLQEAVELVVAFVLDTIGSGADARTVPLPKDLVDYGRRALAAGLTPEQLRSRALRGQEALQESILPEVDRMAGSDALRAALRNEVIDIQNVLLERLIAAVLEE